jgi:hypothetical protein
VLRPPPSFFLSKKIADVARCRVSCDRRGISAVARDVSVAIIKRIDGRKSPIRRRCFQCLATSSKPLAGGDKDIASASNLMAARVGYARSHDLPQG